MTDTFSKKQRKWIMSRVKSKNTKPELFIGSELHKRGYRYRKSVSSLFGKPDLVFKKYQAVIFIHGCFWHKHSNCCRIPKSNIKYWNKKLSGNKERDAVNIKRLLKSGWRVLIVWECALTGPKKLEFDYLFKEIEKWLRGKDLFWEISGKVKSKE